MLVVNLMKHRPVHSVRRCYSIRPTARAMSLRVNTRLVVKEKARDMLVYQSGSIAVCRILGSHGPWLSGADLKKDGHAVNVDVV